MSIIKDLFLYFVLSLTIYYFFKCRYLKSELFNQRENFIKTLGHDFRVSLLAQIRGLDIVQQKFSLSDKEICFVEEINNSCKYSLDMISMLLKIYKIENGTLALHYENINITEIIYEIFTKYKNNAAEKNIALRCNFANNTIYADRENFSKALKILIGTVLIYSKKDTTVRLSLKRTPAHFLFEIEYNGNPISNEEYKRMFALSPAYSTVGHGIQMFLCKKIIDIHKWKIEFKSHFDVNAFIISIPSGTEQVAPLNCIETAKGFL